MAINFSFRNFVNHIHAFYNFAKNLSNEGGYAPSGFASEGGGTLSDPTNPNLDYGNVAYTRRNRFLTTFLYNLPFSHTGNKIVNQLAGGWELSNADHDRVCTVILRADPALPAFYSATRQRLTKRPGERTTSSGRSQHARVASRRECRGNRVILAAVGFRSPAASRGISATTPPTVGSSL